MADHYSQELCEKLHSGLETRMSSLESTTYGNGHEGLTTKVAKIEQDIPTMKSDIRSTLRFQYVLVGIAMILQPILIVIINNHFLKR